MRKMLLSVLTISFLLSISAMADSPAKKDASNATGNDKKADSKADPKADPKSDAKSAPEAKAGKMLVNCPPKGGVKTYGDGKWNGVDHPNSYALVSNRVDGQWIGCTYAGPQGFNFDLSPNGVAYKNCKVAGKGVFECDKN